MRVNPKYTYLSWICYRILHIIYLSHNSVTAYTADIVVVEGKKPQKTPQIVFKYFIIPPTK